MARLIIFTWLCAIRWGDKVHTRLMPWNSLIIAGLRLISANMVSTAYPLRTCSHTRKYSMKRTQTSWRRLTRKVMSRWECLASSTARPWLKKKKLFSHSSFTTTKNRFCFNTTLMRLRWPTLRRTKPFSSTLTLSTIG